MAFKTDIKTVWNGKDVKIKGKKVVGQTAFGVGLAIEGQAKLLAPIDTGLLAGSITTQSRDRGSDPVSPATSLDVISKPQEDLTVHVGTPVEYGPHQEFGTIHMSAQPFLRPAFDLAQGKVLTLGYNNSRIEFKDYLR